jgi:hypothetical protein
MRPISFTYTPVASMWVVTLHNLFLHSIPPLSCHPPSCWFRLFLSQTFSCINTPTFSNLVILHTDLPMKMEQSVLKHWHIKFRRQGITQKKAYNITILPKLPFNMKELTEKWDLINLYPTTHWLGCIHLNSSSYEGTRLVALRPFKCSVYSCRGLEL